MKKYLVAILLVLPGLFMFGSVSNAMSLHSCYVQQGLKWTSVKERAIIAAQYGIFHYKGTAAQNNALSTQLCGMDGKLGAGFSVVTGYQKTVRLPMSASQDYIMVSSLQLRDGTTLSMSTLGDKVFLDIDPGGAYEEIVMCTGIDATTTKFTGCTRGLYFSGTSTASVPTIAYPHNASTPIVMSNVHYVYEQYVDTNSKTQTIAGDKTTTGTWLFTLTPQLTTDRTSTNPTELVTFGQLSRQAIAGAANSSETVKGLSQLATGAQAAVGTSLGSTGARLVIPGSLASSTSNGSYTVPVTKSTGYLDNSFGGVTSSLATLDTNTLVVQNPANATTTATANKIPIANASGTIDTNWIPNGYLVTQSYTAGESIDASTTPLAVYLNSTDGRVYKTASGAATTTFPFIGFAQYGQTKTAGQSINIQTAGVVYNFTGMTTGSVYYISTAGSVSSTAGSINYKIGKAISPTTLLIEKGAKRLYGTIDNVVQNSQTVTTTITTGFTPSKISVKIFAIADNSNSSAPINASVYNSTVADGTGSGYKLISGNSWWINGTTYGTVVSNGLPSMTATYLFDVITAGSNYSRVKVSSADANSVIFVDQFTTQNNYYGETIYFYTIEE